jgi:hypothetical protein
MTFKPRNWEPSAVEECIQGAYAAMPEIVSSISANDKGSRPLTNIEFGDAINNLFAYFRTWAHDEHRFDALILFAMVRVALGKMDI